MTDKSKPLIVRIGDKAHDVNRPLLSPNALLDAQRQAGKGRDAVRHVIKGSEDTNHNTDLSERVVDHRVDGKPVEPPQGFDGSKRIVGFPAVKPEKDDL